jgi:hypothetical protein
MRPQVGLLLRMTLFVRRSACRTLLAIKAELYLLSASLAVPDILGCSRRPSSLPAAASSNNSGMQSGDGTHRTAAATGAATETSLLTSASDFKLVMPALLPQPLVVLFPVLRLLRKPNPRSTACLRLLAPHRSPPVPLPWMQPSAFLSVVMVQVVAWCQRTLVKREHELVLSASPAFSDIARRSGRPVPPRGATGAAAKMSSGDKGDRQGNAGCGSSCPQWRQKLEHLRRWHKNVVLDSSLASRTVGSSKLRWHVAAPATVSYGACSRPHAVLVRHLSLRPHAVLEYPQA